MNRIVIENTETGDFIVKTLSTQENKTSGIWICGLDRADALTLAHILTKDVSLIFESEHEGPPQETV